MLRLVLALLLVANAGWWAASQGWLPRGWLPLPDDTLQREPQRLAAQLRPQAVTVLPAGERARSHCLQSAAALDAVQQAAAEAALQAAGVAAARWQRVDAEGGRLLRVPDLSGRERDALLDAASPAAFSPCS